MRIEFLSERERKKYLKITLSRIIISQLGDNLSNGSRVRILASELMVSAAFSSRDILIRGHVMWCCEESAIWVGYVPNKRWQGMRREFLRDIYILIHKKYKVNT